MSLQEIWDKEEFQPVVKFLNAAMTDRVNQFQSIDPKISSEEIANKMLEAGAEYRALNFFKTLPTQLLEMEKAQQEQVRRKETFANAQREGGL